jgi:hypothetical protein
MATKRGGSKPGRKFTREGRDPSDTMRRRAMYLPDSHWNYLAMWGRDGRGRPDRSKAMRALIDAKIAEDERRAAGEN